MIDIGMEFYGFLQIDILKLNDKFKIVKNLLYQNKNHFML